MQEWKIFEEKQIRTVWDEVQEKWYFCIIDIVQILTEGKDYLTARKYWNKLKQRLVSEDNETVTICHQLKKFAQVCSCWQQKVRLKWSRLYFSLSFLICNAAFLWQPLLDDRQVVVFLGNYFEIIQLICSPIWMSPCSLGNNMV